MMRFTTIITMFALSWADAPAAAERGALDFQAHTGRFTIRGGDEALEVHAYGGPGEDSAFDLWPAGDGGYVITGWTRGPGGDTDVAVLKVDAAGMLLWSKAFGGDGLDMGFAIRTLDDDGIAVAGWTRSFGAGQGDFYLLGLEPDGTLRFEQTFGGPGEERATALLVTPDGGLLVLGESYSGEAGDGRFFLVSTDARGEERWARHYDGGSLHERGLALVAAPGGYLLAGNSMDSRSGSSARVSDGYAVMVDQAGEPLWSQRYGGEAHDIFHHVAPLGAERFVFTGYTRGHGAAGPTDLWFVTVDASGQVEGMATGGTPGEDHNIIARAGPGGVHVAGYARLEDHWDAQFGLLESTGSPARLTTLGGPGDDGAVSLYPEADGQRVVTGYTTSFGAGGRDIVFFRSPASHD